MTAQDRWGHKFVSEDGKSHSYNRLEGITDKHWVFSWEYSENDGYTFMREGANRQIEAEINYIFSLRYAGEVLAKAKPNIGRTAYSLFERMIKSKTRSKTIKDPDEGRK